MEQHQNGAANDWQHAAFDVSHYQTPSQQYVSDSSFGMQGPSAAQAPSYYPGDLREYRQQSVQHGSTAAPAGGPNQYYGLQQNGHVPQVTNHGSIPNMPQHSHYQGSVGPDGISYQSLSGPYDTMVNPTAFNQDFSARFAVDPSLHPHSSAGLQSTLSRQSPIGYQYANTEYASQPKQSTVATQPNFATLSTPPPNAQQASRVFTQSADQNLPPQAARSFSSQPVLQEAPEVQSYRNQFQYSLDAAQQNSVPKAAEARPTAHATAAPSVTAATLPAAASDLQHTSGAVQGTSDLKARKREPSTKASASGVAAKETRATPSTAGDAWIGTHHLATGSPKDLSEAANLPRLKRQPLTVPARDQLLFAERKQPTPAEVRGRIQDWWDKAPVHFQDDLELLKYKAKAAFSRLGRDLDEKFMDDKKEEVATVKIPDAKELVNMSAELAVAKVIEYLRWEPWLPSNDKLRAAVATQFLRLFKALRLGLKSTRANLDAAVEKRAGAEEIQARALALAQRRAVMEAVIKASIQFASEKLLGAIAEGDGDLKSSTMGQLFYLLVNDVLKATEALPTDISGPYPKAILEFLVLLEPKIEELEELKFRKLVAAKYKDNDDKDIKGQLELIVKNAEKLAAEEQAVKAKSGGANGAAAKGAAKKAVVGMATVPSASSPLKRRLEDGPESRSAKKAATSVVAGAAKTNGAAAPLSTAAPILNKPTATPSLFSKINIVQPAKTKENLASSVLKAIPPKPALKATDDTVTAEPDATTQNSLLPKSARQGINPLGPQVADARVSKPEPPKSTVKATAPSQTQSKFASLLADIQEPKKVVKPSKTKETTPDLDETPEQKAKRLRKLERRKLRVSWKEGDALTQVRIFEKDAAEEEGISANMSRDARDDKAEGMQLKRGLAQQAAEEEEEEDEIPYRPWVGPTLIDFSGLPQEQRQKAFVTRGGTKTFHTEQQAAMEQREMRELMVVYTDPNDIPPSSKSPPLEATEPASAIPEDVYLPTTEPKFKEIHQRWAENRQLGPVWAQHGAMQRLQGGGGGAAAAAAAAVGAAQRQQTSTEAGPVARASYDPMVQAAREAEVNRLLTSDKARNWKDSRPVQLTQRILNHPNPEVQKAADLVEAVVLFLRGKPFPATEPPGWLKHNPARVKEWWDGYQRDMQRKAGEARQAELHQQALAQAQLAAHATQSQAMDPATAQAWGAYYATQAAQQSAGPSVQQAYAQAIAAAYQQQQQQQAQPSAQLNPQVQGLLAALHGGAAPSPAVPVPSPQQPPSAQPNDQMQQIMAALAASNQQGSQYAQPLPPPSSSSAATDPSAQNAAMIQDLLRAAGAGQISKAYPYGVPQQQQNAQSADMQRNTSWEGHGMDREQGGYDDTENRGGRRDKGAGRDRGYGRGGQGGSEGPSHLKGINRALIGTKPCMYYRQGKCTKGQQCTFRHDPIES